MPKSKPALPVESESHSYAQELRAFCLAFFTQFDCVVAAVDNDPAGADEDEDDSDYDMAAARKGGNERTPDPRNRSKNMVASDVYEALAVSASEEFAKDFGITDAKDRNQLLRACRKYYRAKELLDAQFADKKSGAYLKKSEVLEREYSKELRRVLPES